MKVYLAYWCNNEQWEDYWQSLDGVFSSYDKAVAYIEGKGYRQGPIDGCEWFNPTERWNKAADIQEFEDGSVYVYEVHSMWIEEMEVDGKE